MNNKTTSKEVKKFDFKDPGRLPLGVKRKLEEVHNKFAENLSDFFKNFSMGKIEVISCPAQKLSSGSALAECKNNEFSFIFELDNDHKGRLTIEEATAAQILNYYLGYAKEKKIIGSRLTRIEQQALSGMVTELLERLRSAWFDDLKIGAVNHASGKIPTQQDELVIARLSVKIEDVQGDIKLVYPFSSVDNVRYCNSDSVPGRKEKLKALLQDLDVEVSCVLGNAETPGNAPLKLTLNQVTVLKPGDIILMNEEPNTEVTLSIQDKNKFKGIPGVSRGKQSMKITSVVS